MRKLSPKLADRLFLYKRLVEEQIHKNRDRLYSHEIAAMANLTAAQVRRDFMILGLSGSPTKGYATEQIIEAFGKILDDSAERRIALIGIGHLGRSLLAYFSGRRPNIAIAAAFDADQEKSDRPISGCPCYPIERLREIVQRDDIRLAIIAVPAEAAQDVVGELASAGITGIVNFAPTSIKAPPGVHIESVDITTAIEKAALFSRRGTA